MPDITVPDITARFSITGAASNLLADVRSNDGFFAIDLDGLDAPIFLPAGGSRRREYESSITKEHIISPQGILITRNGAFE